MKSFGLTMAFAIMSLGGEFLSPALPVFSWAALNAAIAPNHHIIVCDDAHRAV